MKIRDAALSTPPTQEAMAELALSARRLERQAQAVIRGLNPAEREILDRRFAKGPLSKKDLKGIKERGRELIKRLEKKIRARRGPRAKPGSNPKANAGV